MTVVPISTSKSSKSTQSRLPVSLGQLSPWQYSVLDDPLLRHGSNDKLPKTAQIAVIGAGLCGVLTAYHLATAPNAPSSIIILEARDVCSGASGRNAGHCRPDAFRCFPRYQQEHGTEMAKQLIDSEAEVLQRVHDFVKKHNIDCEFQFRDTVEVSLQEEYSKQCREGIQKLQNARNGKSRGCKELEQSSGEKAIPIEEFDTAFTWPAASLNPAKLCFAIVRLCLSRGVQLFSHTPVINVEENDGNWNIITPRGSVLVEKVIHSTNAYASALLPELQEVVIPTRSQAHRLSRSDLSNADLPDLRNSYSLRYSQSHFYSLIQRPDASLVLGTSRGWPQAPAHVIEQTVNTVNDQTFSMELALNTVDTFTNIFAPERSKSFKLEAAWTGIIGLTPDNLPLVGAIPGKDGQFIAAGYNGHGMARIFLCAPGLSQLVLGNDWEATDLPRCFEITSERLLSLQGAVVGH